jgi:membrane protein YqaA with SNARE-associated domain
MVAKAISLFLLSATKFAFSPATGYAFGFSFWQVIVITSVGGVSGSLFFFYLSQYFTQLSINRKQKKIAKAKAQGKEVYTKVFTTKNKLIIKVKQKFGLFGLAAITPAIISIPVGAILAGRFYRKQKDATLMLTTSVLFWSVCLSLLFKFIES